MKSQDALFPGIRLRDRGRPPLSRARTLGFMAIALLMWMNIEASAGPGGRPQAQASSVCPHAAATDAAALGNHHRAARLFAALLSSHRCQAPVWEQAMETWLREPGWTPPKAILRRIEQVAGQVQGRLSRRLSMLAERLRARRLLTNHPPPLDASRFRAAAATGATGMADTKRLAPKGRKRLLARLDAPIWADPLLGHDVQGKQILYVASIRGTILALRTTGKLVWRRRIGESILENLAGGQGMVAAATRHHVWLLDALSGKTLGKLERPEGCGPPQGIQGRLEMICNKRLLEITIKGLVPRLVQPNPLTAGPVSAGPGCRTLGRADGRLVTTCQGKPVPTVVKACSGRILGLMAVSNGGLVAACAGRELVAALPRRVLWKVPLPSNPTGALGMGASRIYVGLVDMGLAQFSKSGRYLKIDPAGATMAAGPVSDKAGDLLVAGRDGQIHRWSERTNMKWTIDLGVDTDARALVLDDGRVLLAGTDGRVLLLD